MNILAGADTIVTKVNEMLSTIAVLGGQAAGIKAVASRLLQSPENGADGLLAIFVLACFVGYFVVWNITPALHSPLMAVTNAISSVIIVGAVVAAGTEAFGTTSWQAIAIFATFLASINIFGGFMVTQRMLRMFKRKAS